VAVAFVLSGGASLGAVEVGMLAALRERGIRPDVIVGTSVGALNGAWLAGHPDAPIDDLAKVWTALHRSDVFPADAPRGLFAFAGWRRSFFDERPLRELIERHVSFPRLEDAPTPLHVVAVEVLTGRDVLLSSGPAVDSVLASAALPALFDPVEIDGVPYMDGGVANNTPISHAVALGIDRVWVLCAGHACALTEPPSSALAMALHALSLLLHKQLAVDVERYESSIEIRVLPPLCPLTVSPVDFSHSAELIDRAYNASIRWLDEDHPARGQAKFMSAHDHPAH
jgi:NTE family protein